MPIIPSIHADDIGPFMEFGRLQGTQKHRNLFGDPEVNPNRADDAKVGLGLLKQKRESK